MCGGSAGRGPTVGEQRRKRRPLERSTRHARRRPGLLVFLSAVLLSQFVFVSEPHNATALTATFGNATIGSSSDAAGSGYKFGSVHSLSGSGTAVSISWYARGGGLPQRVTPVVYRADSAGNPTTLVARGAEVEIQADRPAGWIVSALPAVELAAGNYLLGLVSGPNGEQARVYYAPAANQGIWNANPYPNPTSSWGQINRSSAAWSVYVTYTPAAPPPVSTSPPSISGTPQVGQTLTVSSGSWSSEPTSFAYQWRRCNSSGAGCTDLPGATSNTYTVTSSDVDATLAATVTATNAGGSTAASSAPTATVTVSPAPPVNTSRPTVGGSPQVGQTLTSTTGTWTGDPAPSFARQWQSCQSSVCADIAGATETSYVVTSADVGKTIQVVVTGTNSSGSSSAASAPTATVTSATAVTAFGITTPGTQTSSPGADYKFGTVFALDTTATIARFKWYARGGSSADQSFTPIIYHADPSGQPTTRVIQGPSTTVARDQPAGWVTATLPSRVTLAPGNYLLGLLAGPASRGALIYFEPAPDGSSYWNNNGTQAVPAEWGLLRTSAQRWSFHVELEGGTPPPANTAAPVISGTPQVGRTLTASSGTWSNGPTNFAYQWRRCDSTGVDCGDLAGATGTTYDLVGADAGSTIRVVVTARNAGGSSTASSAPTAIVTAAPAAPDNTTPPTISGSAVVGQTLTVNRGTWTGNPAPTLSQQWQSCQSGTCTDIAGATGVTYVVAAGDEGKTIKVVVTATNSEGIARATSAETSAVTAPPTGGPVPFTKLTIDADPLGSTIEKTLADINNDGKLDAVIGMQPTPSEGGPGGIYWYQFPSSGNPGDPWIRRTILPSGVAYEDMTSDDVDLDGNVDVIASVIVAHERNVYWFRNPGTLTGTWQQNLIGGPGEGENSLVVGDLDGDGRNDVATHTTIFFKNTPTSWTAKRYNSGYNSVALLDIGTGRGSINLAGNLPNLQVGWFRNPREVGGNPRTDPWSANLVGVGFPCGPECTDQPFATAWTGDFDGDARMDIVIGQAEGDEAPAGGLKWFEAPADRTQQWTEHVIDPTHQLAHNVRVADIDGNGALDVVTGEQDQSAQKRVTVYYNDGTGQFTLQVLSTDATHNVEVGDVDGDGDIDILGGPHGFFGNPNPLQLYLNGRF